LSPSPLLAGKLVEVTCVCATCDRTPQVKYNPEQLLDVVHSHHINTCPGAKREQEARKVHG